MHNSILIGDRVIFESAEGETCSGVAIRRIYKNDNPASPIKAWYIRVDNATGHLTEVDVKLLSPEPLCMNPAYKEGFEEGYQRGQDDFQDRLYDPRETTFL